MNFDFTSFSILFQSYQNDVYMIMKGCVQWNSVYDGADFALSEDSIYYIGRLAFNPMC